MPRPPVSAGIHFLVVLLIQVRQQLIFRLHLQHFVRYFKFFFWVSFGFMIKLNLFYATLSTHIHIMGWDHLLIQCGPSTLTRHLQHLQLQPHLVHSLIVFLLLQRLLLLIYQLSRLAMQELV
jgi:hypothetical protein